MGFICFSGLASNVSISTSATWTYCFILVLWILLSNRQGDHYMSTQVSILFYGSCFECAMLGRLGNMNHGFNPCFSGSCFRISLSTTCAPVPGGFQSLFQWILLSNWGQQLLLFPSSEFQSLFQWILLSNDRTECFVYSGFTVSILVLVDLAFE